MPQDGSETATFIQRPEISKNIVREISNLLGTIIESVPNGYKVDSKQADLAKQVLQVSTLLREFRTIFLYYYFFRFRMSLLISKKAT